MAAVELTKQWHYGVLPSKYSEFHRTLGAECMAMDLDWVEVRKGRGIVAFIETTSNVEDEDGIRKITPKVIERISKFQLKTLKELAIRTGVPAYYVIHTNDLSIFHVYDLIKKDFYRMKRNQYIHFLKTL